MFLNVIIVKYLAYAFTIVAAVVTVGLIVSGFPIVGQDAYFHLNNAAQYSKLLSEGVMVPRWAPAAFSGFGSAEFYFYPPLCSVLISFIHLIGLSIFWSMRVLLLLCIGLSFLSCRWYLKQVVQPAPRLLFASTLYAIAPYPFLDMIVRAAYGEVLCLPLIPLVFSAIEVARKAEGITSSQSIRSAVLLAISLTLVLLSSVPMFAVLIVIVPVYVLMRLRNVEKWKILPLIVGCVLMLLCSAFYLLPVWQLQGLVHLRHVFLDSSFRESVLVNLAKSNPGTRTYVELLMLPLSIVATALLFRRWKRSQDGPLLALGVVLSVVVLMHVPMIASILADHLSIFGIIQFPFRFYIFVALALSVLVASSTASLSISVVAVASSLGVLGIGGMFYLQSRGVEEVPIAERLTKSTYEHAPIQTSNNGMSVVKYGLAHEHDPDVQFGEGSTDTIYLASHHGNRDEYVVKSREPHVARFHRFYWPLWNAYSESGLNIPLSYDSNGVMLASLPSGNYRFSIDLNVSDSEEVGYWLSAFGIFVVAFLTLISVRKRQTDDEK